MTLKAETLASMALGMASAIVARDANTSQNVQGRKLPDWWPFANARDHGHYMAIKAEAADQDRLAHELFMEAYAKRISEPRRD